MSSAPPPPGGHDSPLHKFFKNVLMIDPVRNRTYYRFTLISIPLLAAMLVFSTYADDEAQRRADVARRDRDMRRRVTDQAKLNELLKDNELAAEHFERIRSLDSTVTGRPRPSATDHKQSNDNK